MKTFESSMKFLICY